MKAVVVMVRPASRRCWSSRALVDPRARLAVLLGMLGPLAHGRAARGCWPNARTATRPQALMSVMIAAFAFKLVFFGAYVAVMIRVVALRPVPFIASFTGYLSGCI